MDRETFRKLQLAQLDILTEFDRICRKLGIDYYLSAGTLLGAVRHRGFIPWDVDVDVMMLRPDFDRFYTEGVRELGPEYVLHDYHDVRDYNRPHPVICLKDTKLYCKYDLLNPKFRNLGIYIDLFAIDTISDDPEERKKPAKRVYRLKRFLNFRVPYAFTKVKWKRAARAAIRFFTHFYSVERIHENLRKEELRFKDRETETVGIVVGGQKSYERECFPRWYLGVPTPLPFEGHEFFGPEHWDEYLRYMYNDYMTPPPKEAQDMGYELFTDVDFGPWKEKN